MMSFIGSRTVVAQFVDALLTNSGSGWPSITITRWGTSVDFCVSIVIGTSSEGTVERLARTYSLALTRISPENTPVG